jgi:general secretion pathway protein D
MLKTCMTLLFAGALSVSAATLSLNGPATTVHAGQTFKVDVVISGVTDLAYYQFDVGFNPALISAKSVAEGPFLATAGATLFIPGTIDNSAGSISFIADALVGTGSGASGDGTLVTLSFNALAEGVASLSLLSPEAYNSIPDPIAVTTSGTRVEILASTVPEPSTVGLAACGLAALVWLRRRK